METTDTIKEHPSSFKQFKYLFLGVLSYYLLVCTILPPDGNERWYFINTIDLIFHEAGHTLTPPFIFGLFLHIIAGSVYQVMIPFICTLYFYLKNEILSASIMLMWTAESMAYLSTYVGDAQKQALPLLGEGFVIHDWNYLLEKLNLLTHTDFIAKSIHTFAILLFAIAIIVIFLKFFPHKKTIA